MLSNRVVIVYPDFSKPFKLYSNASDFQLGATLIQYRKSLEFWTIKLKSFQMIYTVRKNESLGIVEGFVVFKGIIIWADVTVHTDHLTLLYKKLPSQKMIQ